MEKVELILDSIKLANNMVSFTDDVLESIHKLFFNWKDLFGKEDDWDDPTYGLLFYCVDFFDEMLISVKGVELPPLAPEEKMKLFYEKGKADVMATGKNILLRLEKLLEEELS